MQRAIRTHVCATCRLRSLIKAKQVARGRNSLRLASTASVPPTSTPTSRSVALRAFSTASMRRTPDRQGLSQKQEVEFVERLYTSGNITREEWRESVWIQAGLKRDAQGDIVTGGNDQMSKEDQVRRIHEWYSGETVPAQLLEYDESAIYQRLFGCPRTVDVSHDDPASRDLTAAGTGVLKEADDGALEEIEFDEDLAIDHEHDGGDPEVKPLRKIHANVRLAEDIRAAFSGVTLDDTAQQTANDLDDIDDDGTQGFRRNHPLTVANRFTTSPSTLSIPKEAFIDPVTSMLTRIPMVHLADVAHRIFGGPGLPYSTSTPIRGKTMQQKAIALDAYQGQMSEMDGDLYMSTLMPGIYSSVMSVLTETRKRMGTAWAEGLVRKAETGELKILDAGAGGAGVLAVRAMLRAEWERMHDDGDGGENPMALARADGKLGGQGAAAPTGQATVLIGSDVLKYRIGRLLDNTTFVPRLPDYEHTEEAKKRGKFDLIIAPHNLWPLREDYLRKMHVSNLWSLLSADGGVLLLLEKGVARGFELIAGAREMLLDNRIASSGSPTLQAGIDHLSGGGSPDSAVAKEPGMIIAPCTNHASCPMYVQKGLIKGRRDICAFAQRYHRPAFLQRIFGTKGRNHEDVEFSYISILRGQSLPAGIEQTPVTSERAFKGYENASSENAPHSLTLPRSVLPPLKRHGHIILDLCTPAGTLERWTVPKSFSKQAYRDAKKSSWGDLWALGAKTRIARTPKIKHHPQNEDYADMIVNAKKSTKRKDIEGLGSDDYGRIVLDGEVVKENGKRVDFEGGKTRGRKVKGIRSKRDKKATGNGRRRNDGELD